MASHVGHSFASDHPPSLWSWLGSPFAWVILGFLTLMISVSFDIPAIHEASLAARWPMLGFVAVCGLLQAIRLGMPGPSLAAVALGMVIVVAAASAGWSSDAEYSILRAGSLALLFAATMVGVSAFGQRIGHVALIFDVMFFLSSAIAVGGFLFRLGDLGSGERYVGFHDRATGAASYASLFLPIVIYQVRYRLGGVAWLWGWITLFALFAQIVLSGSRMALATSILIGLFLAFDYFGRRAIIAVLVLFIAAPVPIILDRTRAAKIEERSKQFLRLDTVSTFTGRLDRWQFGFEKFLERPILGFGFGISRTLAGMDEPWRFQIEPGEIFNLHSDQIEVLMDLGIVGYAPFAVFWLSMAGAGIAILRRSRDEARQRGLALMAGVLFAFGDTFMHGGFLSAGGGVSSFSWLLVALVIPVARMPAPQVQAEPDQPAHETQQFEPRRRVPARANRRHLPSVHDLIKASR